MSRIARRGALIVLEGCDRSGKTTQCRKLVDALNTDGIPAQLWRFPERDTAIGQVVSDYLERKCELDDHAVHLLFSANRWELVPKMLETLKNGTTLVIDRYAFSGVAFSAAKESLDFEWCKKSDVGLPRPDLILYLNLGVEAAAQRSEYGGERYEQKPFQKRVAENYAALMDDDWKVIDAAKGINELHDELKSIVKNFVLKGDVHGEPVGKLWTKGEYD
ncbi:hypothetical protein CAPTEDRAFT_132783 [Capitella teleta]|uniref:Thymidylate kinase n=1 Tax=Capitella teleta TaxID=283909 RepID=R7TW13_CAPTE|nr:hypothetical protein CAPTEDRAFT_132783 [Capitella teleta]|eukprot:ELT97772.1 hypothetical protein CAPTEDRAFT_132783 [Capitella teleta]